MTTTLDNFTTLDSFTDIPNEMTWKGAALEQVKLFRVIANALKFPWQVVGHHVSKSIPLPVLCVSCPGMEVYFRDNFHDINVCVVAEKPLTLSLGDLFKDVIKPKSWDWYLEEITRCRGYSWREWTDEQMDDPRLLASKPDAPPYLVKSPERKARWINRLTSPEWYCRDWSSSDILWDGEFGPGATLWRVSRSSMRDIGTLFPEEALKPYKPGCQAFSMALEELSQVETLIKNLLGMQSS